MVRKSEVLPGPAPVLVEKPRNKGGRPKVAQAKKKVEGEGVLRAMRHVLVNTRGYDTDRMEKAARQWYEKEPAKFILKIHELEMQEKAINAGKKESEFLADPGTEKTMILLDRLIKDAKEKSHVESGPVS